MTALYVDTDPLRECPQCGDAIPVARGLNARYCSTRCKSNANNARRRARGNQPVTSHDCRECGVTIGLREGQGNKWICSDECRRARLARSVREFHTRQPLAMAHYRARTRKKQGPDSAMRRFYGWNPDAPRVCESCGEDRVLEVAHRPECPRLGARRARANCKWPEMVWVLCPTCHRLLDRCGYSQEELGLK